MEPALSLSLSLSSLSPLYTVLADQGGGVAHAAENKVLPRPHLGKINLLKVCPKINSQMLRDVTCVMQFSLPNFERYVTKFAPHKALKLIV